MNPDSLAGLSGISNPSDVMPSIIAHSSVPPVGGQARYIWAAVRVFATVLKEVRITSNANNPDQLNRKFIPHSRKLWLTY